MKSVRVKIGGAVLILFLVGMVFSALLVRHKSSVQVADTVNPAIPVQSHEFGAVPTQSKFHTSFASKNTLSGKLIIDRVETSCGCTQVKLDRMEVDPGKNFHLWAELSTGSYCGVVRSQVVVTGHSGIQTAQYKYALTATPGNIIEFIGLEGPMNVGTWQADKIPPPLLQPIVRGKSGLKFTDVGIESAEPELAPSITRTSDDAWILKLSIAKPVRLLGERGFDIKFTFWNGNQQLPDTVYRHVVFATTGPMVASPPSILFDLSAGQTQQQSIVIAPRYDMSENPRVMILRASTTSPNLVITGPMPSRNGIVNIKYVAPSRKGTDSGNLVINATLAGQSYDLIVSYVAIISQ